MTEMKAFDQEIVEKLIAGRIGVIPTDTLYGIVGRAELPETVERIYTVRKRSPTKPCIILISSYEDLKKFGIEISNEVKNYIDEYKLWPGKVSIVLPCLDPRFDYLTRSTKTLAFRMPDVQQLHDLLAQTGPLVAPSANTEGNSASTTIDSAREYFTDQVDFYVDAGILESLPSTLITFENDTPIILREGAVIIHS